MWPPGSYCFNALIVAQLAPAIEGIRLSLHVLAAAIWVGGQIVMAGLVPAARSLEPDGPRRLAQAFARISWPAYVVVLVTGVWNVSAAAAGQTRAWQIVLGIKITTALLAGLGAWLHGRARTRVALAGWGAVAGICSVAALSLGVFLAG